jgi:glycosyltransferase involved in cell wall biosynthesis
MIDGSGINLDRFPQAPVPPGPPVFLLIARLMADKGIREFAAAAARVRARYPAARFRLVGYYEDHPRAIARDEVHRWVDAGTLEYPGPADDVRPHLAGCSVYCLPTTHREGLPRTVLEAMATGRAIVTTDVPGCRETVTGGRNGFLVPPADAGALTGACEAYCQDPGLAGRHGEESRRLAEERFDVHRVNAAILAGMGLDQDSGE